MQKQCCELSCLIPDSTTNDSQSQVRLQTR